MAYRHAPTSLVGGCVPVRRACRVLSWSWTAGAEARHCVTYIRQKVRTASCPLDQGGHRAAHGRLPDLAYRAAFNK